ncbi:MAG: hypothetical protein DRG09_02380 [Epsilonproteobacteria bacterium]|nr:MAG: hypothetical protein DRG09_02380 [Campylobacterota bacterium]
MIRKITQKLLLLFLISSSLVHAIDLGEDASEYLRINGFATIGASTIFEKGQEFRAYTFQKDGVRDGEINLVNNTLLGLQAELLLTDSLSATVQGLIRNDYDKHYNVELDWAYFSYDTGYDLTLRAGKFRLPLFKSSELTYVGYARTSVRPELAVYGAGGFSSYTGVDALYKTHTGTTDLSFQLGYGYAEEHTPPEFPGYREFKSDNAFIAKATAEKEVGLLSMTYFRANSDFLNIAPNGNIRHDTETLVQMLSVEGELHYENLSLEVGLGKIWVDKIQPDEYLRYGTLYYQMGDWRPYMTYSYKKFEEKPRGERPPGARPPPPGFVPPPGPALNRYEEIVGIGVRYDFHEQAALKIQLDHVDGMESQPQLLISDDQNDRKATVLTITVDMVF